MNTFITLFKWTDQGIKDIKGAPIRFEAATKLVESMGGHVVGLYATLGEYDLVAICEAPDDETATAVAVAIGAAGNVRTTTLRAFTAQQFAQILRRLP